jgi:hypothetical protein
VLFRSLEEAEPLYVQAARSRPEYVQDLYFICNSFFERGDDAKAKELALLMIQLDPNDVRYKQLLSEIERMSDSTSTDTSQAR